MERKYKHRNDVQAGPRVEEAKLIVEKCPFLTYHIYDLRSQPTLATFTLRARTQVELVSDDLTRILSEQLPNFQTLSVNFCTRSSFERTDREVNIDLYYTSRLIKFGNLEVFRTKKCQVIRD